MGLALVGASLEGRGVGVLWAPTAVGQRGLKPEPSLSSTLIQDSTCGGEPTGSPTIITRVTNECSMDRTVSLPCDNNHYGKLSACKYTASSRLVDRQPAQRLQLWNYTRSSTQEITATPTATEEGFGRSGLGRFVLCYSIRLNR